MSNFFEKKIKMLCFHAAVLVETFKLMYLPINCYFSTDIDKTMIIYFLRVRTDTISESSYGNMSSHKNFYFTVYIINKEHKNFYFTYLH